MHIVCVIQILSNITFTYEGNCLRETERKRERTPINFRGTVDRLEIFNKYYVQISYIVYSAHNLSCLQIVIEEDGSQVYLVDFQKKAIDKIVEDRDRRRKEEEEERERKVEELLSKAVVPPPANEDEEWLVLFSLPLQWTI